MSNEHVSNESSLKALRRKRWLSILLGSILLLGFIYFIYWVIIGRFYQTTDNAYVSGNQIQVMSKISGQVIGILAEETNFVKKGTPLVTLDQTDAKIALNKAESELALATRQVSQFYESVSQLQSNVKVQESQLAKAKEDYQRRQGLVVHKTISEEELRHASLEVDKATQALASAKYQLDSAIAMIKGVDLYHHPQIQQAMINLRNAYLNFQRTIIYAPENGYVAKRNVTISEEVNPANVLMVIVPLNQVWVNANFKETQVKHFRIGQPVTVISDTYGDDVEFHGKIAGLSPGTGSAFDLLPPQNATGNWIKVVQRIPVRITLDPEELEKHPLQIGLSMTVTVNTHDRSGKKLTQIPASKIIYQSKDYSADLDEANKIINTILQTNAKNMTFTETK